MEQAIAFKKGYIQAIKDYGIWKNGTQTIGCMETPVKEVIQKIEKEIEDLKLCQGSV